MPNEPAYISASGMAVSNRGKPTSARTSRTPRALSVPLRTPDQVRGPPVQVRAQVRSPVPVPAQLLSQAQFQPQNIAKIRL